MGTPIYETEEKLLGLNNENFSLITTEHPNDLAIEVQRKPGGIRSRLKKLGLLHEPQPNNLGVAD